jgi:predicted ATPase
MRTAERVRIWTAVREAPKRDIQVKSFQFSGIPGIQNGTIAFQSPITAICGVNGTGKSAILRGIWAALRWDVVAELPEITERLGDFTAEVLVEVNGATVAHRLPIDATEGGGPSIPLLHIDPSFVAASLQKRVCRINNLDEVLEPHAAIELSQRDREVLSFILNKQYESVEIYEIDDYEDEDLFTVVFVRESEVPYDTRTMSLGEISVLTIFWALNRAEKGSVILLEEPETYLSPVSQGALMDYLATVCVQKQISLILTTHSPQMLARLSKDQVKFAYRTPVGATLATEAQFDAMRRAVGLIPPIDRVLLVEDRAARELTINLLRKFDHATLLRSEITDVGGAGEVSRIAGAFPHRISSFKMIGLYDGDSRGALAGTDILWPAVYLPGDEAIERHFRDAAESNPVQLGNLLGRSADDVTILLPQIRGLNHHDWFEEFAKGMGITYPEAMHACFELWISDEYWRAHAENFLIELLRTI